MTHLFTSAKSKTRDSPTSKSALYLPSESAPSSSPRRIFSEPIRLFSSRRTLSSTSFVSTSSTSTEMPRSPVQLSSAKEEKLWLDRTESGGSDRGMDHKTIRRQSHDPKINVYTECGRHGDDWLFGGFSVSGTVKSLWEKRE
jgi:hypothetical protein